MSKDKKSTKVRVNKKHNLNNRISRGSKAPQTKVRRKKTSIFFGPKESNSDFFNNREAGWLNFNLRVLAEAQDNTTPLLERFKFLSISTSNLDEFFMKRVGGFKRQIAYAVNRLSSDGLTPKKQLMVISKMVEPMIELQKAVFNQLKGELKKKNLQIVNISDLNSNEKEFIKKYFKSRIFPILIPLSVDPGHPFPFISNLSMSLAVSLVPESKSDEDKVFARVKIPKITDQWIKIGQSQKIVSLIEVVKNYVHELFPQMKVAGLSLFKVTRNADSDREGEDEDAEDLLANIEEELRQRRFAEVVRLEMGACTDPWLTEYLKRELEITDSDIYSLPVETDLSEINSLVSLAVEELSQEHVLYPKWTPVVPAALLEQGSIFSAIDKQDVLVHHPFESFSASVERFIYEASIDSEVLAIKMTLYRTGDNSPIIRSLIRAAERGKQVVCLIELKARFDEERNIYWAQELENAGVHVVYGMVGLKTHAKTTLVIRREPNKELKSYAHLGTGNYNVVTSRFYTDVSLLTSHPGITEELKYFFNSLTGTPFQKEYEHLLIAPNSMLNKFKQLIQREANHAESGRPALIMAKFNNMEEHDISMSLYDSNKAGVETRLIIRGFCCLKPNLKNLSERIHVQSTIGRFLEHSRIFYFRNGQEDPVDGDFFIGSADWMYRNLHARVEVISPVYDRKCKEKLWEILQAYWQDEEQTWIMTNEGRYIKRKAKVNSNDGVHKKLMDNEIKKTGTTEADLILNEESHAD